MNPPSHFEQLLQAAAAQPEPQRLLFVFATAELPDDATLAQRLRFEAGEGGTLTPVSCVDKGLDELTDFDALATESRAAGFAWQMVFAAGLSGRHGQSPGSEQVGQALQAMVERVRDGRLDSFLTLGPSGEALHFIRTAPQIGDAGRSTRA